MKRKLAALAAVLVVAGCGADVNSGTVTEKHYEAAYSYFLTQCMAVGKNPCGSTLMVPAYEPEHYVITLTSGDESEDHYVDPQTYKDTNIGDTLTLAD